MEQNFKRILMGEAFEGKDDPEQAHIDLIIGPRGSAVEHAFTLSLAAPSNGHTPLLAILAPNLPAKPSTLIVNKVTIKSANQAVLMYGPAQTAVAKAVIDCVSSGIIPEKVVEDLFIIVSVYLEWDASDKKKIFNNNYRATKLAIERAISGKPTIEEIMAQKDTVEYPYT
jgi:5,6,7,8-tetrahydromethanopterin hydro-lyase